VLTRRRFVKLMGGAAALAALPLPGCGDNITQPRGAFFDEHGWATIDAATESIFPGAHAAMAVRYIDQLLSAFEAVQTPRIFAGGPYSGRAPYPDPMGQASNRVPDNDWVHFVPLSRVKQIAWRVRIYGSAHTQGGDFNDALLGPVQGYRDQYTDLVHQLDLAAADVEPKQQFRYLSGLDQVTALSAVGANFPAYYATLLQHTLEGLFSAPEYGGNADTSGWQLANFDGDSAPLGYAFYDTSTNTWIERPEAPTSTSSPGDMNVAFDDDILDVLTVAAVGSGGKRFF
jgi:hypothetical protein